ncbi:cytochrome P450 [Pseudonocardia spinosispora]|uniref:cytochrome P450 n=1 Tax=Pseudonocardia spinosispora TaxID=103441 RepID=UPI0003F7601D|nr:cytochrome P450 [Pseudonocardia spinosispora]
MSTATTTSAEATMPDEIARAVVLPESYVDEKTTSYPAFRWLRENNPLGVARVEGFDPLWIVTKFADIQKVEVDNKTFGVGEHNPILATQAGDEFFRSMSPEGKVRNMDVVVYMDPPEHDKIRKIFNPWFRPGNVRRFEDQLRELAKKEVARMMDYDGEVDFMADIAGWFTLRAIVTLFGAPMEDEQIFMDLSKAFFGGSDPEEKRDDVGDDPAAAAQQWANTVRDFNTYFTQKTQEYRGRSGEDLLSIIANSEVDGEPINDGYANGQYIAMVTAGHDTTSATASGTMLKMIEQPELLSRVASDISLAPKLVEEGVRWVSPVKHFMRTALCDTELRGRRIKEGERLMMCFPSGNRDEESIRDPEVFDLDRKPNRHLGFGHGAHMCIGQRIARSELQIFWEELLPKLKSVELAGEPKYLQTNFVGGLKSLPIRFKKA